MILNGKFSYSLDKDKNVVRSDCSINIIDFLRRKQILLKNKKIHHEQSMVAIIFNTIHTELSTDPISPKLFEIVSIFRNNLLYHHTCSTWNSAIEYYESCLNQLLGSINNNTQINFYRDSAYAGNWIIDKTFSLVNDSTIIN